MRGKWLVALLVAVLSIAVIGCPSPDDPPEDDVVIDRTLIVEDGAAPVWIDSEYSSFLFVYQEGTGDLGIYRSDMDGNVDAVYLGAHNHDYTPSPDGSMVAFSTPNPGGGVLVVTFGTDGFFDIGPGKNPAWVDDASLVITDAEGRLVQYTLEGIETELLANEGSHAAISPDGNRLAYLVNSSTPGLALRYAPLATLDVLEIGDRIGTDLVWAPTNNFVFASQLNPGSLSDVVRVHLALNNNIDTEILGATKPSLNADGTCLFANRVTNGGPIGVIFKDLQNGDRVTISNAINPAAAEGNDALVEQVEGIYFITF